MKRKETILIVDDDPRICRLIRRYLEQEGYRVITASCGREMRRRLSESKVDLVLLDVHLPDEDGFSLAKEHSSHPNLAIIMVTGKADARDKVLGLELGADDYVTKPFDERELLARVRSVLRRVANDHHSSDRERRHNLALFAGWQLDLAGQELRSPDGTTVFLTTREFQLLAALVDHAQHVVSRDFVLELLSGRDWTPIDRSIDVLVGKLRKKLGDDAVHPILIKTVRGAGYKLASPVEYR